jgi:hypothetical protein
MRRKIGIGLIALASVYFANYCVVRTNSEIAFQDGRYRIKSMHNALFSDSVLFKLYRPLVLADQLTMGPEDVDHKPE